MTLPQSKSYTTGHFELRIDGNGNESPAYLKSVDGGWARANVSDDPVGADPIRIKQISSVEIEPFSLEFGLAGAKGILKWISESWDRKFSRRHGQITHANFNLEPTFEHEFTDALITETTFPTLDGASKEAGYIKCKIQPERVITKKAPASQPVSRASGTKQKLWTTSAFRFNIDGIDEMKYTSKLDSFTIKQGIKKVYTGPGRFPMLEPTKIEFPNLTGTIALEYADKLLEWHQQYIQNEAATIDPRAQKTGSLEFLSPDRKQTIFSIDLYEVGILFAGIEPSAANADQIKRVKFELYVHRMKLDTLSGFD